MICVNPKVQLEYTGEMKLFYPFTKSFIKFTREIGIVADSDANVLNVLEEQFGVRLIETNDATSS